jgi:hypothetical protein
MAIQIPAGLNADVQRELAQLIHLSTVVERELNDPPIKEAIELAMAGLLMTPPNVDFAVTLRRGIERRLRAHNRLYRRLFTRSGVAKVVLGLSTLLAFAVVATFVLFLLYNNCVVLCDPKEVPGADTYLPLGVVLIGALGGIVSIMVRVEKFGAVRDTDPWVLFFTGFFKPIVGMSFAFFLFAFLNSGLTGIAPAQGKEHHFFLALAFVAGFSERFIHDVASRAERYVVDANPGAPRASGA